MKSMKNLTTTGGGIALLVVAIICLNIIASRLYGRLDVTHDEVFSLSDGTRKITAALEGEVTAKLYFTRSIKELPVVVKTYATRVEEVLQEYAAYSGGKLRLEVIDPRPDTDEEEWAQKYGLTGVRLPKGDQMFFGVVFVAGSKEIAIPYFDPRREEFLEYDLSEALVRIFRKDGSKVGVLSSLPVLGGGPAGSQGEGGQDGGPWAFAQDLQRNFGIEQVAPDAKAINKDLKVLLLIHPKTLSEETLYAIDQYVMSGGRLIVAVDPMSRIDLQLAGQQARGSGQMPQASSDLDKLFKAWGVEYDKASIVGDPAYTTQINAGGQVLAYPFFLTLPDAAFAKGSVITGNLKQMLFAEGGAFALKEGSGNTLEPLLSTSGESGTANAMMASFMMPQEMAKELKVDSKARTLAGLLRGKLKSAFPSGAGTAGAPHKAEADQETTVLLVADTDFLADQNSVDKFRIGNQVMARMRNDNVSFIANAVDLLGGSQELIGIRSRGRIARPFTRVTELQKTAQMRWQSEEEKLTGQLTDLQKKLNEIQQQRTDGNRMVMTAAQQDELKRFREEERKVRVRRREVRKSLREDIEALGYRLVALNMLVVPLATSAFGLGVFVKRSRRTRKEKAHG